MSLTRTHRWHGTCWYATRFGHLEVLKWARREGCPWNCVECRGLAERFGHARMVRWIDEQGS